MIKLKARTIPEDLSKGQLTWTANLINLIKKFGDYNTIPAAEKKEALQYYNLDGVKKQLKATSNSKCFFCESYIGHIDYPHIEHFWPKSLYPKYTFKWSNFLLACGRCNIPKDNFDTKLNPFINPILDNPEDFLAYNELRIIVNPLTPNYDKSFNTIEHCDLRRTTLYRLRAPLRISFNELEYDLEIIINEYNKLLQHNAKMKRALKIHDALNNLKDLCSWKSQYAGYVRDMVRKSEIINDALQIIESHFDDLGIQSYEIYQNYG